MCQEVKWGINIVLGLEIRSVNSGMALRRGQRVGGWRRGLERIVGPDKNNALQRGLNLARIVPGVLSPEREAAVPYSCQGDRKTRADCKHALL